MERKPIPREHIAEAAYYNAERRGFVEGGHVDDWLQAEDQLREGNEREIDGSVPPDIVEPDQIERRASEFGLSAAELRVAIQQVGPLVEDIRAHLGR